MAERLVPLLAMQVARVRFPVPARPTFRVEKVTLFCNPASGGTFSSTAVAITKWVTKIAEAQATVDPHLEAWVRVGRGMPHVKGHNSELRLRYFKE
jgi:hypothetical protein